MCVDVHARVCVLIDNDIYVPIHKGLRLGKRQLQLVGQGMNTQAIHQPVHYVLRLFSLCICHRCCRYVVQRGRYSSHYIMSWLCDNAAPVHTSINGGGIDIGGWFCLERSTGVGKRIDVSARIDNASIVARIPTMIAICSIMMFSTYIHSHASFANTGTNIAVTASPTIVAIFP